LVFNDHPTTKQGIVTEILKITQSDLDSYPIEDITRRVNMALDRFVTLALTHDGEWQFDDSNYTDYPIGYKNLVNGQQDYLFNDEMLQLSKVLVKDSAGNWKTIRSIDQDDPEARNTWERPTTNLGTPFRYDVFDHAIFLDPVPNYDSANGLQAVFKRNASKFASTDTSKQPGIPSPFHPWLCWHASIPELVRTKSPDLNYWQNEVDKGEEAIKEFISSRNRTTKLQLRTRTRRRG
jgi:hypothetical protein